MKKIILSLTVCIASVFFANGRKLSEDQKIVQNTIIKTFDALSDRDSIGLKAQCTADVLFFEYGKTWTLDTLITKAITLNRAKDFKRINKIDFINTTVDRDVAWATYNNYADITQNGNHQSVLWIETVILVRERKTWKIKVLHSTLLKNN